MSMVHTLDKVAHWLEKQVCENWELKEPGSPVDTVDYDYKLVKPNVFAYYVPVDPAKRPPNIKSVVPSICVQPVDATDDLVGQSRIIKLRLSLAAYDPGIHGKDWIYPYCDVETGQVRYRRGDPGTFEHAIDGWRDIWNFVDRTVRIIENNESMASMPIDKETGVSFGPFSFDADSPLFGIYWDAWIEVSVRERLIRNTEYRKYL